ncbi:hypothetical protein DEMA109039_13965 [Deinococcus marmoris]
MTIRPATDADFPTMAGLMSGAIPHHPATVSYLRKL